MDSENPTSKFVDDAEQIAASGRADAFKATLVRLAGKSGSNAWYVELLAGLSANVSSEYLLLKKAHSEQKDEASLLAWRARNLLELSAWALYCEENRENARRLYEDAGRDVTDILNLFHEWGKATAQEASFLDPLAKAKLELSERAASEGIETLEGPYKQSS